MKIDWEQHAALDAEGELGFWVNVETGEFLDCSADAPDESEIGSRWAHLESLPVLTGERWPTMPIGDAGVSAACGSIDDARVRRMFLRTMADPALRAELAREVHLGKRLRSHAVESARWQKWRQMRARVDTWDSIVAQVRAAPNEPPWLAEALAWRDEIQKAWRSHVEDLAARLVGWLEAHDTLGPPRPGLSEEAIAAFERELGRALPGSWKAMYRLRDGQSSGAILHNCFWMPLESVRERAARVGARWLALFDDGAGDVWALDPTGAEAGVPWSMHFYDHEIGRARFEYVDLDAWLETYVEALEAGMFARDETGLQPRDWDAWDALRSERCCSARWLERETV